MLTKPFKEAMPIVKTLTSAGYETYFVGGCVRDILLNKTIKDVDIATAASPEIVMKLFKKVIPVGLEHGTVIVRMNQQSYEVTTFRVDGAYSNQRHPDEVIFVQDVKEDLKRRDFTINALAMTMDGQIIDLFHGKKDIEDQLIRTVGIAKERFLEDPLRIIRALRFSAELGFKIEENTYDEMNRLAQEIDTLAIERLTNEFTRFFKGNFIKQSYEYLLNTTIAYYLPIFKDNRTLLKTVPAIKQPFYSFAGVIVLFHHYKPTISINEWIKAWKCSNRLKKQAHNLQTSLEYFQVYGLDSWLVYLLQEENVQQFIQLVDSLKLSPKISVHDMTAIRSNLQIKSKQDIVLNGHALLQLFPNKIPGPWMSDLIKEMEKRIVLNEVQNNKKELKEWILCHRHATD